MLKCSDIYLVLDGNPVLNGVDFQLFQGQKVALTGHSGCGKSTLLKTVLGWHTPSHGTITIGGLTLKSGHLPEIRRRIFYLSQDVSDGGFDTVDAYLAYPFRLAVNRHLHYSTAAASQMLTTLGLKTDLLPQEMYKLSGGEKKRLGLVRGLMLGRDLLLLDEPTSGIDAENRNLLVDYLNSLKNVTVLTVTHDSDLMNGFDRCITMENGRILKEA